VRRRGSDSGGRLTPQCCRCPCTRSADQRQRESVDEDEEEQEERAPELSATVDLVEPVGADKTGDGAEMAADDEGVCAGVEVRRRNDERHDPRADDDATRSTLTVSGTAVPRQ